MRRIILTQLSDLRIGQGHDTHRLVPGGPLRIGGIDIDFNHHLDGHSDADVLLHAITDALLAGARQDDIGTLFPNSDPSNRDRCSIQMLQLAWHQVQRAGFQLINLDCIVFAEQPRLAPHRSAIIQSIAAALNIPAEQVWLKAKTGEGLDAVGLGQAISAQAIALLMKNPRPS